MKWRVPTSRLRSSRTFSANVTARFGICRVSSAEEVAVRDPRTPIPSSPLAGRVSDSVSRSKRVSPIAVRIAWRYVLTVRVEENATRALPVR
jgi:hypothetical protein